MKVDTLIIGGGVAGLAAAIRLTELGIKPLVIEGGSYPAHKVCGEFISPSGCALLKKWDIHPIPIAKTNFRFRSSRYQFTFPKVAGALSHLQLDPQLALRAKQGGAKILMQTKVEELTPTRVRLNNGDLLEPKHLLIATGRLSQGEPCYYGYKAHYADLKTDCLEMFSFAGGYMGIAPIEGGKFNVAAISKTKISLSQHPFLRGGTSLFKEWMEVPVGKLGVKKTPDWPNAYFIGDAAGTTPPATGNGITLALLSGIMGAEFSYRKDPSGFKRAWLQKFKGPILWGNWIHRLMMRPSFSPLVHFAPSLYQKIELQ